MAQGGYFSRTRRLAGRLLAFALLLMVVSLLGV